MGHNDGALLFAFGSPFGDYRPTLQACARVFFGRPFFAPGPWDELGAWLRAQPLPESLIGVEFPVSYLDRTALRLERADGWASLRAVAFRRDRPAQSDQLHVSIWAQGKPIVLDPGTYRYNGAAGFENRLKLASSAVVGEVLVITVDDVQELDGVAVALGETTHRVTVGHLPVKIERQERYA